MKRCKHCNIDLSEVKSEGLQCKSCRNYLARYGMNRLQILEMYESQNGKCKLCDEEIQFGRYKKTSVHVDHCHDTGRVRGMLCLRCNTVLGMYENLDKEIFDEYIKNSHYSL